MPAGLFTWLMGARTAQRQDRLSGYKRLEDVVILPLQVGCEPAWC